MFPSHLILRDPTPTLERSSRPRRSRVVEEAVRIRLSEPADARAIMRLAALDSKRAPGGELLLAEVGGELVAAVPVVGGDPIADPFRHTAALVELLELRAAQLRDERAAEPDRPRARAAIRPLRASAP